MASRLIFLHQWRGTERRGNYVLTEVYVELSLRAKRSCKISREFLQDPLLELGSVLEFREFFVALYWFSAPYIAFTWRFRYSLKLTALSSDEGRDPLLRFPSPSEYLAT
jgi:hypothetical protein